MCAWNESLYYKEMCDKEIHDEISHVECELHM